MGLLRMSKGGDHRASMFGALRSLDYRLHVACWSLGRWRTESFVRLGIDYKTPVPLWHSAEKTGPPDINQNHRWNMHQNAPDGHNTTQVVGNYAHLLT